MWLTLTQFLTFYPLKHGEPLFETQPQPDCSCSDICLHLASVLLHPTQFYI